MTAADNPLPRWLPRALREPRSVVVSLATAWPLILFPSLALAWLAQTLLPGGAKPDLPLDSTAGALAIVVIAPVLETLIMAVLLEIGTRVARSTVAIAASALLWGIAHSLATPGWGLVVWWPFLIFSTLYVAWKPRGTVWALLLPMASHALHNLTALAMVRLGA